MNSVRAAHQMGKAARRHRMSWLSSTNETRLPLTTAPFSAAAPIDEVDWGSIKGIPLARSSIPHSGDRRAHDIVLSLPGRRETAGGCRT